MRIFIKIVLIAALVLLIFFNYKYISFDKGISKQDIETKNVTEFLQTLSNIKSVQYYKKTFTKPERNGPSGQRPSNYQDYDYKYKIYIVTTQEAYLLDATQDDIDSFNIMGVFSSNLQPELIKPIPFYIEIILALIILVIPFGRKKSEQ